MALTADDIAASKKNGEEAVEETRLLVDKHAGGLVKLIKELALIGYSDPAQFVEVAEGGELRFRPFDEMGKKRKAIKNIKEKTVITESKDGEKIYKTSTVEYDLWDKVGALKELITIGGYRPAEKKDVKINGLQQISDEELDKRIAEKMGTKVDRPVDK